jgi:Raf kinase inhibitor-like YbhB/YbcL family protein
MFRRAVVAILLVAGIASACGGSGTGATRSEGPTMSGMSLTSATFADGGPIPASHSCDGADVSPPLAWSGVPAGTRSFVLIVDDPDARGFVHWVAFDLPAEQGSLAEGASGGGSFGEGRNDFGRLGWGGPCPPSGTHRYIFELSALDRPLGLSGTPTADDVRRAMAGHVLGSARLTGTYRRGG